MATTPPTTQPGERSVLDDLLRAVQLAADTAAIDGRRADKTYAAITGDAVRAALECAIGNGLIDVVPRERWPQWIAVNPPYNPDA